MTRMIGRMAVRASAAALLSVTATAAMAQTGSAPNYGCPTAEAKTTTCVNGGGSSLAAFVYAAPATTTPSFAGGELTEDAKTIGGTIGFSYEKASSGAGQSAFLTNLPSNFNGTTTETGYAVHFAASDAYVDANSVLFPYVGAGHPMASGGQFIQFPMFATPIAIPVANAKMIANGTVTLNDSDLCGIFSGRITNWNKTSVATKLTPGTINVYWRADNKGSGTTFLLTQHLAAVCTSSNTLSGFTFKATTKFATLFNGVHGVTVTTPPNDGATLWTIPAASDGSFKNFLGVKGSNGVADGVNNDATESATGYLSPDYTAIAKTPATSTAAKPYTKLFVADVKNAKDSQNYLPTVANTHAAISNPGNAVDANPPALTEANKAAVATQTNWVPQIATPAHGYPIVGYTNWIVAQCYKNNAVASAISSFLRLHFGGAYTTLLENNGFQPVIGAATKGTWSGSILSAFVSNTSGLNLNIQNATTCKGVVGR